MIPERREFHDPFSDRILGHDRNRGRSGGRDHSGDRKIAQKQEERTIFVRLRL